MKTNKIKVVLSLNKTLHYSSSVNRYSVEESGINGSNKIVRAQQPTATEYVYWVSDPGGSGNYIPLVNSDSDTAVGSGFGQGLSKYH